MPKKIFFVLLSLSACLFMQLGLGGCSHGPAGFAPSTSLVTPDEVEKGPHVVGGSSYLQIFGIPFGRPDYEAAIQDAVGDTPNADGLLEARAWSKSTFIFIGFIHSVYIEGKVAIRRDQKASKKE
jgi:hypothetical protein